MGKTIETIVKTNKWEGVYGRLNIRLIRKESMGGGGVICIIFLYPEGGIYRGGIKYWA